MVAGRTVLDAMARTVAAYGDRPAYSDQVAAGISTPTGVADAHLGRAPRDRTQRRGRARRPRPRRGRDGRDHGHQPDRARRGRPCRAARRRGPDVHLQHAVPGAGLVHRRPRGAAGRVPRVRGPCRSLAAALADVLRSGWSSGSATPGSSTTAFVTWDDLLAEGRELPHHDVDVRASGVRPDDPATILYTSGTTGDPKGVVLSHANVVYECEADAPAQRRRAGERHSVLPPLRPHRRAGVEHVPPASLRRLARPPRRRPGAAGPRPRSTCGRSSSSASRGCGRRSAPGCPGCSPRSPTPQRKAAIEGAMAVGLEYVESLQVGRTTTPRAPDRGTTLSKRRRAHPDQGHGSGSIE